MRQGLTLTSVGAVVGVTLAAILAGLMGGMLYQVGTFDPLAWGVALSVLILASLAANLVPARRAMRVDPVTALRTE
jgi:ABC-type antimicrobial peptide transport system permease subunit